jgi:hypothetical protein
MLRQLAGSSLSDGELGELLDRALPPGAGGAGGGGLDAAAFRAALAQADLAAMAVRVPTEDA